MNNEANPNDRPGDPSDDDVIQPDSVTPGSSSSEVGADDDFGLDDLANKAVEVVFDLLGRASSLARAVSLFAVATCVLALVLGVAALGGGVRVLWIIVGGFFAAVSIGSTLLAMFRLRLVQRGGDAMADELRTLIGGDAQSERTVIDTVESTQGARDSGIVNMSKQFFSLRDAVGDHTSNFAALSVAMASITSFPGLMALATVIGFGMLGVSAIFALILIF